MGHFFRVRECCCGGLREGSMAIGVLYMLLALFGATIDEHLLYSELNKSPYSAPDGRCGEIVFLPVWKFCCLVSVFMNLALIYGAFVEKALLVAPWLAWHLALPFAQSVYLMLTPWSLVSCPLGWTRSLIIYSIVTFAITLLPLLYFAAVVYSLYKDLLERTTDNNYGTNILLPSTNWDAAMTPYTNCNPGSATPRDLGSLQAQQHTDQLRTQHSMSPPLPPHPQTRNPGIPRPKY